MAERYAVLFENDMSDVATRAARLIRSVVPQALTLLRTRFALEPVHKVLEGQIDIVVRRWPKLIEIPCP